MIIEYYTHKPELSKIRTIQIGHKVVGVRVLEVTITSQEELNQLLSDNGVQWARKHLRFPPKKIVLPEVTEGSPEDWTDVVDNIPSYFDCGYNCGCATQIYHILRSTFLPHLGLLYCLIFP